MDDVTQIPPTPIHLADDSSIDATSKGTVKNNRDMPPIKGLVVPTLTENLLSAGQLADNGVVTLFSKSKVEFFRSLVTIEGVKVGEGRRENHKYMVWPPTSSPCSYSASLLTWNNWLSHIGETSLQPLHHQGVIKVDDWEREGLENCDGCRKGNMTRKKFGSRTPYKATRVLEVVHFDVVYHIIHKHQVF